MEAAAIPGASRDTGGEEGRKAVNQEAASLVAQAGQAMEEEGGGSPCPGASQDTGGEEGRQAVK